MSMKRWVYPTLTGPNPNTISTVSRNLPTVILIHGFDSSNLEFRRLGSRLAARGIDTYAVDLLGWGYTQLDNVLDFSASAKVEALQSFIQQVVIGADMGANNKKKFCIAGASLGGAAAIDIAVRNPNDCAALILLDAQGFVDWDDVIPTTTTCQARCRCIEIYTTT
jgi:pimeloyl-ACP methyl ester carboxylesterase